MATKDTSSPTSARALLQLDPTSKSLALTDLPVPKITPHSNEHLIRVHAVALCNGELLWPRDFPPKNPCAEILVPGNDVAGTIVDAPDSSPVHIGDEVYARTNFARTGDARDYIIGLSEELAHRPQRLSWVESAAIPMSSQTAWQALFVHAELGDVHAGRASGKRILVTGASGGVGQWVVQLAHLAGAEVIATCGSDNLKLVETLGAKTAINYHATHLREWGQTAQNQVDIVIDCSGRQALADAWWTVRDGGFLISIVQPPEQVRPIGCKAKDVGNFFFIMQPKGAQLEQITKLVEEGKCHPAVDSVWRLEDYKQAFERADSGHAVGKVVLDLMGTD